MPPLQPQVIGKPKLLLVEGPDDQYFFEKLRALHAISDLQIVPYRGITNLRPFLRALRATPGFGQLLSLGIVRDSDQQPSDTLRSVQHSLSDANLPVPQQIVLPQRGSPQVSILLLPDDHRSGMLETLCLDAVAGDPVMSCLLQYINCAKTAGMQIRNEDKALVQAFLATRPEPGLLLGQAAQRNYFPLTHPCFDHVKQFLMLL